ncbi:hypothetical protein J2X36_004544 [Methylobacterium sp. BE186]|uniref:hypothetical protein n=1 Tax=Methylobacterium sp. BE186 TaxID=2817715 RepID=UPI0028589378|nr:hypothetical protein [Methylobacterium sp. BE186]MDR7039766.1 hypothetical protein [Methylobacterium sp. BE186]
MALKLYYCIGYHPDVRATDGAEMECYVRASDEDTARQIWAEAFDLNDPDMDQDEFEEVIEEMNFSANELKTYPEDAAANAGAIDWGEIYRVIKAGV